MATFLVCEAELVVTDVAEMNDIVPSQPFQARSEIVMAAGFSKFVLKVTCDNDGGDYGVVVAVERVDMNPCPVQVCIQELCIMNQTATASSAHLEKEFSPLETGESRGNSGSLLKLEEILDPARGLLIEGMLVVHCTMRVSLQGQQILVSGAGGVGSDTNGLYVDVGRHNGRPKYKQEDGESLIYYWVDEDSGKGQWHINDEDDTEYHFYSLSDTSALPPSGPWTCLGYDGLDALPAPSLSFVEVCQTPLEPKADTDLGYLLTAGVLADVSIVFGSEAPCICCQGAGTVVDDSMSQRDGLWCVNSFSDWALWAVGISPEASEEGLIRCPLCDRYEVPHYQELHTSTRDSVVQDGSLVIKAHASILWARCPAFRRMLEWKLQENQPLQISIDPRTQLTLGAVRELVSYLYTGVFSAEVMASTQDCAELVEAAHYLDLPDIVASCAEALEDAVTPETLCDLLALATRYELKGLRRQCASFIQSKPGQLTGQLLEDLCQEMGSPAFQGSYTFFIRDTVCAQPVAKLASSTAMGKRFRQDGVSAGFSHCSESVLQPVTLQAGLLLGNKVFFIGKPINGAQVDGDAVSYRHAGVVVGKGYTQQTVCVQFEGNQLVSDVAYASLSSSDPGLPGHFATGDQIYYVGTPTKYDHGDLLAYGASGLVMGSACFDMGHTGVRVVFQSVVEELSVCTTDLSRADPGLPGDYHIGDTVYFNDLRKHCQPQFLKGQYVSVGSSFGQITHGPDWDKHYKVTLEDGRGTGYVAARCIKSEEDGDARAMAPFIWDSHRMCHGIVGKVVGAASFAHSRTHVAVKFNSMEAQTDVHPFEITKECPTLSGGFSVGDDVFLKGAEPTSHALKDYSVSWDVSAAKCQAAVKGDMLKSGKFTLPGYAGMFSLRFCPQGWTTAKPGQCSFFMWSETSVEIDFTLSVNGVDVPITERKISSDKDRGRVNFCAQAKGGVHLAVKVHRSRQAYVACVKKGHKGKVVGQSGALSRSTPWLVVNFAGLSQPVCVCDTELEQTSRTEVLRYASAHEGRFLPSQSSLVDWMLRAFVAVTPTVKPYMGLTVAMYNWVRSAALQSPKAPLCSLNVPRNALTPAVMTAVQEELERQCAAAIGLVLRHKVLPSLPQICSASPIHQHTTRRSMRRTQESQPIRTGVQISQRQKGMSQHGSRWTRR